MLRTFNFRSPVGIAVLVMTALLVLILGVKALNSVGVRFDPFELSAKRLAYAEQTRDLALQDAAARRIEAAGAHEALRHVEQVTLQIRAADQIAFHSATDAAEAPDANSPVDPQRLERLRLADERLCQLQPALCGQPTASTAGPATGH